MADIEAVDLQDWRYVASNSELEEAGHEWPYDPDNPYGDLTEDDLHALHCEHRSLIIGRGNSRHCEDCGSFWR